MAQTALALFQQGRLAQAESLCRTILAREPHSFDTLHLLGVILCQEGNFEAAVPLIARALKRNPKSAAAHSHLAIALLELKAYKEALASCDRALRIQPGHSGALNNRGNALRGLKRYKEALGAYDRALAVSPDARLFNNRGMVLCELRRPEEAIASFARALALNPRDADALNSHGVVLYELKRHREALASFDRALTIRPDEAKTLNNRGNTLRELGRPVEAIADFEHVLRVEPDFDFGRGNLLLAQLDCCDWSNYDQSLARIAADVAAGRRAASPFTFLSVSGAPSLQLQCARTAHASQNLAAGPTAWKGGIYRHDRIRLAYLSADFYDHATAYLMAGLFEAHDKSQFETAAISFGPDRKDEMRARLEGAFDHFIDARTQSDEDIAQLLKRMEIDIAVDLKGYTQDNRCGIFAFRPAPIQVNYLGYPGTMGADYMDYIVADRFVIRPDEHCFYAEKIALLPDSYQPNDPRRRIADRLPTRREAGLPEAGFVFCAFNNPYKIAPPVFDIWMRLLHRTPGSVLWLQADNDAAMQNLLHAARTRGIAPDRLVFAPRLPLEHHLARHRLAGLLLDTLPINAHTTASDALWAGLPVVTCVGTGFAGRVAGSLLNALGLAELIAGNLEDYEALALKLAREERTLAAIKAKLAQNRDVFPLFDADRTRRHLESAYRTMWQRHQRKEPAAGFAVSPLPR